MTPRDYQRESRLPSFSLDRRVTVLVIFLTLAVVGLVAASGIPAELFPRGFTEPQLWVGIPWADAPAREVLDTGAQRIETELEDQPRVRTRLQHTIGRVYMGLGLYDLAEPLLDEALQSQRERIAADHPTMTVISS